MPGNRSGRVIPWTLLGRNDQRPVSSRRDRRKNAVAGRVMLGLDTSSVRRHENENWKIACFIGRGAVTEGRGENGRFLVCKVGKVN